MYTSSYGLKIKVVCTYCSYFNNVTSLPTVSLFATLSHDSIQSFILCRKKQLFNEDYLINALSLRFRVANTGFLLTAYETQYANVYIISVTKEVYN